MFVAPRVIIGIRHPDTPVIDMHTPRNPVVSRVVKREDIRRATVSRNRH